MERIVNQLKQNIFQDEFLLYVFRKVKEGFYKDLDSLPLEVQVKYYASFTFLDDSTYLDSFSSRHIQDVLEDLFGGTPTEIVDRIFKKKRKKNKNENIRKSAPYRKWQKSVFKRDGFKCCICGCQEKLNAHHKSSFATDIENRFNVDNGITMCEKCHQEYHHGKGNIVQILCLLG